MYIMALCTVNPKKVSNLHNFLRETSQVNTHNRKWFHRFSDAGLAVLSLSPKIPAHLLHTTTTTQLFLSWRFSRCKSSKAPACRLPHSAVNETSSHMTPWTLHQGITFRRRQCPSQWHSRLSQSRICHLSRTPASSSSPCCG